MHVTLMLKPLHIIIIKYCPFLGFLTKTYRPCSLLAVRKLVTCIIIDAPTPLIIVVTFQAFVSILHLFTLIHHISHSCLQDLDPFNHYPTCCVSSFKMVTWEDLLDSMKC